MDAFSGSAGEGSFIELAEPYADFRRDCFNEPALRLITSKPSETTTTTITKNQCKKNRYQTQLWLLVTYYLNGIGQFTAFASFL